MASHGISASTIFFSFLFSISIPFRHPHLHLHIHNTHILGPSVRPSCSRSRSLASIRIPTYIHTGSGRLSSRLLRVFLPLPFRPSLAAASRPRCPMSNVLPNRILHSINPLSFPDTLLCSPQSSGLINPRSIAHHAVKHPAPSPPHHPLIPISPSPRPFPHLFIPIAYGHIHLHLHPRFVSLSTSSVVLFFLTAPRLLYII